MERIDDPRWRKASYSGANGGGCIEVGEAHGTILVRDTKNRRGAVLRFSPAAWRDLTAQLKK